MEIIPQSAIAQRLFIVIPVVPYTINGRSFEPGKPRPWMARALADKGLQSPYDLALDGKRFVGFPAAKASAGGEKPNLHLTFLLNFFDELRRRAPASK